MGWRPVSLRALLKNGVFMDDGRIDVTTMPVLARAMMDRKLALYRAQSQKGQSEWRLVSDEELRTLTTEDAAAAITLQQAQREAGAGPYL